MADDPKATNPPADPPADPPEGDSADEKKFWKKLEDTIDARFDAGVERVIQKHGRPGASRTGKLSFPEVLANTLFGPKAG